MPKYIKTRCLRGREDTLLLERTLQLWGSQALHRLAGTTAFKWTQHHRDRNTHADNLIESLLSLKEALALTQGWSTCPEFNPQQHTSRARGSTERRMRTVTEQQPPKIQSTNSGQVQGDGWNGGPQRQREARKPWQQAPTGLHGDPVCVGGSLLV